MKFIPNLASLLHPLHELLKKDHKWEWTKKCSEVFAETKEKMSSAPVLAHHDPSLPIILVGDASAYGIGAVISHSFPDALRDLLLMPPVHCLVQKTTHKWRKKP